MSDLARRDEILRQILDAEGHIRPGSTRLDNEVIAELIDTDCAACPLLDKAVTDNIEGAIDMMATLSAGVAEARERRERRDALVH